MSNEKMKNTALIIAAAMLLLALLDGWQYGFFTLLRFVVFASTAYVAWTAYQEQKEKWTWVLGFVAVLFNPFLPVHLTREIWISIDFFVAIFLLSKIFFLRFKNQGNL